MRTTMFNILDTCLHGDITLVWFFTWSHTIDLLFHRQWAPNSPDGRFAAYSVMYAYKLCLMMSSRARKQNITVFKAKFAACVRKLELKKQEKKYSFCYFMHIYWLWGCLDGIMQFLFHYSKSWSSFFSTRWKQNKAQLRLKTHWSIICTGL